MASIASTSADVTSAGSAPSSFSVVQAGPLPSKRGEIGFTEGVHDQPRPAASAVSLPARHPDERGASIPSVPAPAHAASSPALRPTTSNDADGDSNHSSGKRSLISFLSGKRLPRLCGITASTLVRFVLQLAAFGGTIAAWALVSRRMSKSGGSSSASNSQDMLANTAPIFVHVAFGIVTLAQALLLERVVFRMRAERYLFVHPGAVLPGTMARELAASGNATRGVLALAPWNRPGVPTYAAALAENGIRGTGDVEDGLIAQPPPPAYGKTRGSMMLLSGFMSDELRERARLARTVSMASQVSQRTDRPVSYRSHDSAWDEHVNAGRARMLEDTLSQLERSDTPHRRSLSQDSTRTVMPTPPPPAVLPPSRDDSLPLAHVA